MCVCVCVCVCVWGVSYVLPKKLKKTKKNIFFMKEMINKYI